MPNDEWRTPRDLFERIQRDMGIEFILDPCTTPDNPLGTKFFYTSYDNGLKQPWGGLPTFVNPPYSRGNIDLWVAKCAIEANYRVNPTIRNDVVVVALLPLRTAKWFKNWVLPRGRIIRDLYEWRSLDYGDCGIFFLESRVKFIEPETGLKTKGSPTWDSFLAIWV